MSLCCDQTLTTAKLCCGSLEFCKKKRLDGENITWIKLRILCDSDGYTLWNDSFTDLADVRACLESNGIQVYHVKEETKGLYVARATSVAMNELNEWQPESPHNQGLCVRTFITILNDDNNDMFSSDSCWLTTQIGNKSINHWYESIKTIPCRF